MDTKNPPRNLEIGGPRPQPATKEEGVNWRGLAMLAMIPLGAAGGSIAAKWGDTSPTLLYGGYGLAMAAFIALIAMHRAGFNPPTDYAAEGKAQRDQDKES